MTAAEKYHQSQAQALSDSGVDFIMGATLPAVSEALGMAAAISGFGLPYVLSFVIRPDGSILDGTPLHTAITAIDSADFPEPLFYMVNCVHPTILGQALEKEVGLSKTVRKKLIGIQANTSLKSPEELDGLEELDGSKPERLSDELLALHRKFGIKVIGGCCGTDQRHLEAIAARLSCIND